MSKPRSAWALVATAPDQLSAEMWQELLEQEGIPSLLEPAGTFSFLGPSTSPCRILVPEEKVADARAVLADVLELPPDDGQ